MNSGTVHLRLVGPLVALLGGAVATASDPTSQPSSILKRLAPPDDVLSLLETDDPETQIEGFATWHAWRSKLTTRNKRAADRFLAREQWLDLLGHEVLYDIESGERRLRAYKLLRRIGGQRVFPYFLWGIGDGIEQLKSDDWKISIELVDQTSYVRGFFKRYGDPTVITHLPDETEWRLVIARIKGRWSGRELPEQTWEPLTVERFEEDLFGSNSPRRCLAIRALTTNGRYRGFVEDNRYGRLLADPDEAVRLMIARSLVASPCPDARSLLKRTVEDGEASVELRRLALEAVSRCRTAQQWTAEWMIAAMPDWPATLDPTIHDSLVRLQPLFGPSRRRYTRFLERELERVRGDRAQRVIAAALEDLPS